MCGGPSTARFGDAVRNLRLRPGVSQEVSPDRAELHLACVAGIETRGRNAHRIIARPASASEVSASPVTPNFRARRALLKTARGNRSRASVSWSVRVLFHFLERFAPTRPY